MGYVYHGSSTKGLTKLEPRQSTHGEYVYATNDKVVATIFCKRAGDDVTYNIKTNKQDGKYELLEYLPGAFDKMFECEASIYTLSDETFEDKSTGFCEVMSEEAVDVIKEDYIPNVFDELKRLENNGELHIYRYDNLPEYINYKEELINQLFGFYLERYKSGKIPKEQYLGQIIRMNGYHPELLERINEEIEKHDLDFPKVSTYSLLSYYRQSLDLNKHNPERERYLDIMFSQGIKYFPELKESIYSIINDYGYDFHPLNEKSLNM